MFNYQTEFELNVKRVYDLSYLHQLAEILKSSKGDDLSEDEEFLLDLYAQASREAIGLPHQRVILSDDVPLYLSLLYPRSEPSHDLRYKVWESARPLHVGGQVWYLIEVPGEQLYTLMGSN